MQTKRNYMAEKQNLQLSIIVPLYGVEKYIRPCIDSIFRQGLDEKCYEVIIVNDGTKDRSMEITQDIIDLSLSCLGIYHIHLFANAICMLLFLRTELFRFIIIG